MSAAENDATRHDVRADGPTVVRKGPPHGPVVIVLDPHGDAKHDELPATWRGLAEDVRVVWWRLPAGEVPPVELTTNRGPLHLVGADGAALLTLSLAAQRPDAVRSVVLVDPPGEGDMSAMTRTVPAIVHHVLTTESDQAADRLPIGHPDVVVAVLEALMAADLWPDGGPNGDPTDDPPGDAARRPPGAESLMSEAWQATRARLADLLGSLRHPG